MKPGMNATRVRTPGKGDLHQASNWRFYSAYVVAAGVGLALLVKIAMLQVVPDVNRGYEFLQGHGQSTSIRLRDIPAYRGTIMDRNGAPLAISTPLVSISLDPQGIKPEQLPELEALLGFEENQLREEVEAERARGREFMYLQRSMLPKDAEKILTKNFSGVKANREFNRFYPEAEVLAQVLGLTNVDDKGIEGLELGFDHILRGVPGEQRIAQDLNGDIIDYLGVVTPAQPGSDLQLTIDLQLQYLAYRALKAAMVRHNAAAASMVIMEPHSGEVLAMASQPSFNPNSRPFHPIQMRNRALIDDFEPGSTVKPFTLMAAMEQNLVSEDTWVDTAPIEVGGKLIQDTGSHQSLSVPQIIAKSSQVGTVKIAMKMPPQDIHDMFQRVGFGEPPGLGFPGETGGLLPQHRTWNAQQHATFSFGYGLSTTVVQLAQAYAVIANGGKKVSASLVKGVAFSDTAQVVSPQLAASMRTMMEGVVSKEGTGRRAQIEGVKVAGKTGTGHLVGAAGYEKDRYAALFAGMVPADQPEYVAVVVVMDPRVGGYFGGQVAAPVFSEVMTAALRMRKSPSPTAGSNQQDVNAFNAANDLQAGRH